ncbi:MAG: substrate-binding domain-containing protein [Prevotellaceae bacterium]|jgi:phosphate transport system substrate-binding protein|nr:substrate-binding domain-containing protein [Prevotellaceae bacterium]
MKNYNLIFLVFVLLLSACNNRGGRVTRTDTLTSGMAVIAADDCYAPILAEEIAVFTGLNAEAGIDPVYAGEKEIFEYLFSDSIRLIVAARDLTDAERIYIREKLNLTPRSQKIATDGIALIVNPANRDTLMTVSALQKIMNGEITRWKEVNPGATPSLNDEIQVVFDHPSSSTLRFIADSICRGEAFSERLRALNGNREVVDYVASTPNALGVIGVNWISNPSDSTKLSFDKKIRVVSLSRSETAVPSNSYKPFPAYFATGNYPLTRDMYVILTDLRETLPAGFVKFVAGDSGQRIILKAGLVPATRPTRLINIQPDF